LCSTTVAGGDGRMKNRHGQMDQDLFIRDLEKSLDKAIELLNRQLKRHLDPRLEYEVDQFLYDMEKV